MPMNSDDRIERYLALASALPGATGKLSHGAPSFFVDGRMFVTMDNDHHGSGHLALWCNAPLGTQEALVGECPEHYFVPPYVGTKGWIGMRIDNGLPWTEIEAVLRTAHETTRKKR